MKVAIIPARGGSKRIPGKNVKVFAGLPMIAHAIGKAQRSGLFDQIIVSTDDRQIAACALRYGASVPFWRPAELADDHTGTQEVMQHAVRWLRENGVNPEFVCCLYATCPLLEPRSLVQAAELLRVNPGKRFAFSVTTFAFPIQRALRRGLDGTMRAAHPEHSLTRSQDLEPMWHDAGQFYWGDADAFLEALPIYAPHSIGYPVARWRVQDIDTEEDWVRAEYMYSALRAQEASL